MQNISKNSYKNFIALAIILMAIYALVFFVMRVGISIFAFEDFASLKGDFIKIYLSGLKLDLSDFAIGASLLLLLGYLNSAFSILSPPKRLVSNFATKFLYKFALVFATLTAFIVIVCACVNFYYFKTYHTKIDIFIFGLKDDDTAAILQIIWQDYPIVWVLLICVIFTIFIFKLSKRILNTNLSLNLGIFGEILANLALIVAITLGYIISIVNLPLRENAHHISANPIVNQVAINPIISLGLALKHYRKLDKFAPINPQDLVDLERELFPIFQHNSQNAITKNPSVVMVLMESFASNMLSLDDEKDFDVLGNFRAHFMAGRVPLNKRVGKEQNDFTFINFLSSGNGTAPSFSSLFFLSPSPTISLGKFKNHKLPLTPFDIYKKAGYKVIFLTSSNRYWQNLGAYITALGADEIYDSNVLNTKYPQSIESQSPYGVADEFAYNFALELLQNAKQPLFIAILTSSNHKPFILPKSFTPPHYELETKRALFNHTNQAQIATSLFTYSSSAFGDFVGKIKDSPLKNSVIIAASGDHRYRDLKASANLALNYAVPFYLFIPTPYLRDFKARGFDFNGNEIGAHKDIFPTLYALSLNEYDFLTLGGRNLFDKNAPKSHRFALNSGLFMDSEGIYAGSVGYKILENDNNLSKILNGFVMQSDETFDLPKEKADFMKKYNKLEWLQINYRIFGENGNNSNH